MPPVSKPAPKIGPKAAPKATGLSTRVGGFPLYVWIGGIVLAVAVGLYFRSRQGANAATAAPGFGAAGGGEESGGGAVPSADPGMLDLADAIWGLTGVLGAGSAGGGGAGTGGSTGGVDAASAPGAGGGGDASTPAKKTDDTSAPAFPITGSLAGPAIDYGTINVNPVIPTQTGGWVPLPPGPIGSLAGPAIDYGTIPIRSVSTPQALPPANVNPANVVSVRRLASGATVTTLASGRQIQQAPGRKPYVISKGEAPTRPAPVRRLFSIDPTGRRPGGVQ